MVLASLSVPGAALALAQSGMLAAAKIACTPQTVTRCQAGDRCSTRPASPQERGDVMVLDFAAKRASVQHGDQVDPLGAIAEDRVAGGVRRILVRSGGSSERLEMTLTAAGRLTLVIAGSGRSAVATCVPAP